VLNETEELINHSDLILKNKKCPEGLTTVRYEMRREEVMHPRSCTCFLNSSSNISIVTPLDTTP
jgi:hypothetical protein